MNETCQICGATSAAISRQRSKEGQRVCWECEFQREKERLIRTSLEELVSAYRQCGTTRRGSANSREMDESRRIQGRSKCQYLQCWAWSRLFDIHEKRRDRTRAITAYGRLRSLAFSKGDERTLTAFAGLAVHERNADDLDAVGVPLSAFELHRPYGEQLKARAELLRSVAFQVQRDLASSQEISSVHHPSIVA